MKVTLELDDYQLGVVSEALWILDAIEIGLYGLSRSAAPLPSQRAAYLNDDKKKLATIHKLRDELVDLQQRFSESSK